MNLQSSHLAQLAAVSDSYIRRLTREGILPAPSPEGYDALPAVRALIRFYKQRNERADDLATARLDKTRAEAELTRLKVSQEQRKLVPAEDFADIICRALEEIRAVILSQIDVELEDKHKMLAAIRTALEGVEAKLRPPGQSKPVKPKKSLPAKPKRRKAV